MGEEDKRNKEGDPDTRSVLDVVEEEYPGREGELFGGLIRIGKLLTLEDWLNILTRSRSSHEKAWKEKK